MEFTPDAIDKATERAEASLDNHIAIIAAMPHVEMARLLRYAPAGHPYFVRGSSLSDMFEKRFKLLGGMTSNVSKIIGWDG